MNRVRGAQSKRLTTAGSTVSKVAARPNATAPVSAITYSARKIVVYLLLGSSIGIVIIWLGRLLRRIYARRAPPKELQREAVWDVCIVGAGPAGATCAYYLAKQNLRVLLIDKAVFPRDKICGDQVHQPAITILNDMGVMQRLLNESLIRWSVARGIVSPSGASFVGEIREKEGLIAVQRIVLDEHIVLAARSMGAHFRDGTNIRRASFDRQEGIWTLYADDNRNNLPTTDEKFTTSELRSATDMFSEEEYPSNDIATIITCRVLVCADGAQSSLARRLEGLTESESPASHGLGPCNAIGCRAFAKQYTHECRADEVCFYSQPLLPGYFRMFAELDDYLNLSCFLLPNPMDDASPPTPAQVFSHFYRAVETETWIRAALGRKAKISHVQTAPMRVGGIRRSYMPHGLILGDAAGQQDPLTGDGLQYGMRAAQIAAEVIGRCFQRNDFSMSAFKKYDDAWKSLFGWDFLWGKFIVSIMARYPRLIDATAKVIQRKGMKAILFWALVRSGVKSKFSVILWFLRPDVFPLIIFHLVTLWLQGH